MQVVKERLGPLGTNTYLVRDEQHGEAMLIDPAAAGERLRQMLAGQEKTIKYIVATHGHSDHVAGLALAKELTGARILIHLADAPMLQDVDNVVSRYLGVTEQLPAADGMLTEGDVLHIGSLRFSIMHTPGHTPGGICLLGEGVLFSGDTLFAGSIGRYDLDGGDFSRLQTSLNRLRDLPEETVVYPGHGPETTIGTEKQHNRFLR